MKNWPTPQTLKGLRGFLRLTGYYRKFVKNYGVIAKPLTDLLKKDAFLWGPATDTAFKALKEAMSTSPVLGLPDFSKPFIIETDASTTGIGVMLMQGRRPLAYFSKALGPRSQKLSTYERKFKVVLAAVQRWKHYLMGIPFVIKTDHEPLKHLLEHKLSTCVQMRGMSKLLGLQYKIEYKKGVENKAADALSRRHEDQFSAMAAVTPSWMEEIQRSYTADPYAQNLIQALTSNVPKPPYNLQGGMLRHKGKIYIGATGNLRQQLLQEHHCSPHGGHSGIEATWRKLRERFFWPGLMGDVDSFIKACEICQRVKPLNSTPGLLQPLPIPTQTWNSVSLDFIEGLPRSHGYDSILVVVHRLTKYAHFIPLSHPFSALKVAQLFHDQVARLHGYPSTLISNRDKVFTSLFWGEIFKLNGTKLCMSISYHPQSDDQTERVNRCLEDYLRCMCLQGTKQ
ncbi:hypothetical protein Dimus_038827 [Dionaea muscipula]